MIDFLLQLLVGLALVLGGGFIFALALEKGWIKDNGGGGDDDGQGPRLN
jgi:hypothetical protein